jgi:hypothetical protein
MQHDDHTPDQEEPVDLVQSNIPAALVVFGDADEPLVELCIYDATAAQRRSRIELDAGLRAAVSALLAQAPALAQSGHAGLAQTYRLTFAPGVASKMADVMQAKGGGLRALALDQQRKIIGQGVLRPANGLRTIAAVTAIWQTLAVITAQVYLSEINVRLANIERGIDEIRAWLEADQFSKIETAMRYVREAAVALGQPGLSKDERDHYADKLEDIWRECGQISRTLLAMLNRAPAEFATLPLSAWYQLEESARLAREAIETYERRSHAYLMAEYVRCATIALRTTLELHPGISEHRLDELRDDRAGWGLSRATFQSLVVQRVENDLWAKISTQSAIDGARRDLLAHAYKAQQRMNAFYGDTEQLRKRAHAHIQAQQNRQTSPMTLIVALDKRGQVAETYHIPVSPQEPALKATRG